MAKVKIIACDGHHSEGLVPADGRVGVQRGDERPVWRDFCTTCLNDVLRVAGGVAGAGPARNGNGPGHGAKRRTKAEVREMADAVATVLLRGAVSGVELQKQFGMTYAQMSKTLSKIKGVRKLGHRNTARWTLKKGKVGS